MYSTHFVSVVYRYIYYTLYAYIERIYLCLEGVAGMLDGQGMWKDPTDEEDVKPVVQNGLNLMNGSAFGMNSLLQGSMMGMNGYTSEGYPFGEF